MITGPLARAPATQPQASSRARRLRTDQTKASRPDTTVVPEFREAKRKAIRPQTSSADGVSRQTQLMQPTQHAYKPRMAMH